MSVSLLEPKTPIRKANGIGLSFASRAELEALCGIFLGRRTASTAPHVQLDPQLRPGDPPASTERVEYRDERGRKRLVYRHHVGLDPERVAAAWALVGSSALGGSIVIDAEVVGDGRNGIGPIVQYQSVYLCGDKVKLGGAFVVQVAGTRIVAANAKTLQRMAETYLLEVGEVDWMATDIWKARWTDDLKTVTDVRVWRDKRYGQFVTLYGQHEARTDWTHGLPQHSTRPGVLVVQLTDEGRWVSSSTYYGLAEYERWREGQRPKVPPVVVPDVADEDALALEGLAW